MLQSLKTTLLASLGVVAFTREKLNRLVQELVEQGELTSEQGKRVLEALVKRGDDEGKQLMERVSQEVERWLGEGPVVARGQFQSLEERVRALESRMDAARGGESPGAATPQE
jgi:polyhydroxyalkanoate synthesis regulator phasin